MFALLKKHNGRSRRSFGSIITIIVTSCQGAREVQWFETVNDPLEPVLLLTRTACLRMTSPCLFQLRRSEPSPSSSCYRFKAKQSQQTARVKSGCADDVDQDRDAHSMLEILDDDDPDRPYVRVHGYYSWDPVPEQISAISACVLGSVVNLKVVLPPCLLAICDDCDASPVGCHFVPSYTRLGHPCKPRYLSNGLEQMAMATRP